MKLISLVALGMLMIAPVQAQDPFPIADPFRIDDEDLDGHVSAPGAAVTETGRFLVVWASQQSLGTDPSWSVQSRLYERTGAPLGVQFQLNGYTTGLQTGNGVAALPGGGFIVSWSSEGSYGSDTYGHSIQGRRLDSEGSVIGDEFQVNSYSTGDQMSSRVAVAPDGGFVVTWRSEGSYGSDTDDSSIQAQRFDQNGDPEGAEFQVNTYTNGRQDLASVAVDSLGNFVVVWESDGSDGADTWDTSIQARRFDSAGTPRGTQFQVNSSTAGEQENPSVAFDPDGNFMVVWNSEQTPGDDVDGTSIVAQRFDGEGVPLASEFQVNSDTTGQQRLAGVWADQAGNFVVSWYSSYFDYGSGFSFRQNRGQRLDPSGDPIGGEFRINLFPCQGDFWIFCGETSAALGVDPQGHFVAVWAVGGGPYGGTHEAWGRRFEVGDPFKDGFETGDTSAWTDASP